MKNIFKIDEQGWKSYPMRIVGPRHSECCDKATLLVESSKEGRYVTANCSKCNERGYLTEDEFRQLKLWVSCPRCNNKMEATMIENKFKKRIYIYHCIQCNINLPFSALLPRWEDLMK